MKKNQNQRLTLSFLRKHCIVRETKSDSGWYTTPIDVYFHNGDKVRIIPTGSAEVGHEFNSVDGYPDVERKPLQGWLFGKEKQYPGQLIWIKIMYQMKSTQFRAVRGRWRAHMPRNDRWKEGDLQVCDSHALSWGSCINGLDSALWLRKPRTSSPRLRDGQPVGILFPRSKRAIRVTLPLPIPDDQLH